MQDWNILNHITQHVPEIVMHHEALSQQDDFSLVRNYDMFALISLNYSVQCARAGPCAMRMRLFHVSQHGRTQTLSSGHQLMWHMFRPFSACFSCVFVCLYPLPVYHTCGDTYATMTRWVWAADRRLAGVCCRNVPFANVCTARRIFDPVEGRMKVEPLFEEPATIRKTTERAGSGMPLCLCLIWNSFAACRSICTPIIRPSLTDEAARKPLSLSPLTLLPTTLVQPV